MHQLSDCVQLFYPKFQWFIVQAPCGRYSYVEKALTSLKGHQSLNKKNFFQNSKVDFYECTDRWHQICACNEKTLIKCTSLVIVSNFLFKISMVYSTGPLGQVQLCSGKFTNAIFLLNQVYLTIEIENALKSLKGLLSLNKKNFFQNSKVDFYECTNRLRQIYACNEKTLIKCTSLVIVSNYSIRNFNVLLCRAGPWGKYSHIAASLQMIFFLLNQVYLTIEIEKALKSLKGH